MTDNEKVVRAQAMASLIENLPQLIEWEILQAKLIRARYLALVREGFTEAQALILCSAKS